MNEEEQNELIGKYIETIESNPVYSLQVDPENKYDMPDDEKRFIKAYCEFKDLALATAAADIDVDTAQNYFISFPAQQEIRRIDRAVYQRQFKSKLLSYDDIGGWLSSQLTGENVPLGQQLKAKDKLEVAKMIIALNDKKMEALNNPITIMQDDVEKQIKELSVDNLKELIEETRRRKKSPKENK